MASLVLVFKQPRTWIPESLASPFKIFDQEHRARWVGSPSKRLLSGFLAGYLSGPGALTVVLTLVSGVFLGFFVLWVLEVVHENGNCYGECSTTPTVSAFPKNTRFVHSEAVDLEQDYEVSASGSEDHTAPSDAYAHVVGCELSSDGVVPTVEVTLEHALVQGRDVHLELPVDLLKLHTGCLAWTAPLASTDATLTSTDATLASEDCLAGYVASPKHPHARLPSATLEEDRHSGAVAVLEMDGDEFKFNPHAPTFVPPSVSCPDPDKHDFLAVHNFPAAAPRASNRNCPTSQSRWPGRRPAPAPAPVHAPSRQLPRGRTAGGPNAKWLLLVPQHHNHHRLGPAMLASSGIRDPTMERYKRICHWRGTAMAARRCKRESIAANADVEAEAEREAERVALEVIAKVVDEDEDGCA
ncbi:hypothetical protein DICSQDRAFT_141753 [Dichomitus squalens LYAD-421 SS1]|uniref:Uncharacterized protein n=1 Tax=Dichomitus squalens (strain LYAD-421) TaxID=732165 RepID=R7SJA7_DICSQ|nr:uncharacterized protein DICSQDRAFT_141753 [Dichomitus squalens LYAD-421 SS1]EJF55800.1 hypothetical protein DICSQDRAFT_141753 [Dichomitus squalens LYAD-421 SS1]